MSIRSYLKNKKQTHFQISGIEVFVKDEITDPKISIKNVIQTIIKKVPSHLMRKVKSINIGQFSFLASRDLQASYKDSKIFVTNEQKSEKDMLDDIIHEIAHSVEELYPDFLYLDKNLEKEFLAKRKNMWNVLTSKGYELDLSSFLNPRYDRKLDMMLYREIGYPILSILTASIFHSPYAATSLSEYFADAFEAFYMREELDRLKGISPKLYEKIVKLTFANKEKTHD